MDLPQAVQDVVQQAVQGVGLTEVARAAELLSSRYRAEVTDGNWHVSSDLAARAYLVTRLPATFAAVQAAMSEVQRLRPGWTPVTVLDVGAGPGTACWAARATWPALREAELLEGSAAMRSWGERLSASTPDLRVSWHSVDLTRGLPDGPESELVTLAYVLNELPPQTQLELIGQLWQRTADTLLIVEPGTTAGWQRLLAAREQLLALGAQVLSPCPHAHACPVRAPDWCHFSQRVARSRMHRQGKHAEMAWEDEKYAYLAVSRQPGPALEGRVLAAPQGRSGFVNLKLCTAAGDLEQRQYSKRQGQAFKQARKLDWGDALPLADDTPDHSI